MKPRLLACCLFYLSSTLLLGQTQDPVFDSLSRPLPPNATVKAQVEQVRSILWYIFRTEEQELTLYPSVLDSLYKCCIEGKTKDKHFEKQVAAEVIFFKASEILIDGPKEAKLLLDTAVQRFAELRDSTKVALSYAMLSFTASGLGDSLAFVQYRQQAIDLSSSVNTPFLLAFLHNNLGVVCYNFGMYAEAAGHYYEALALIEKFKTSEMLQMERDIYHNLGGIYRRLDDYKNALKFIEKAIKSAIATGQDPTDHYTQLGLIYIELKDYQRALEAFLAVKQSNKFAAAHTNFQALHGLAQCYLKLGDAKKALPLAQKSVALLPVSQNRHYGGVALVVLADCEFELGMTDQALQHALAGNEALFQGKNKYGNRSSTELLMKIYKKKGNYRKALEYSEQHNQLIEQVERQQSARQLAFGEFTRENEVKNARREAQVQAQLVQQRNIRFALFAGLGVLALLILLLYHRYRFKQKTAQQLEIKNAEIEAARARAEKSEAFKSRFLANMSHEIRTPLHGIAGYTDLVLETPLSEKQRRYLNAISQSNERLTEVVNDILDLSKLEAGEVKLRQVAFSPAQIAQDVQVALAPKAKNKGLELLVNIDDNVPAAVLGDPTRLYQILMNLAGNAVKFTDKGFVRIGIEGENPIRFSVSDTGIGIPTHKLTTIFESFHQAEEDTTARFGGTGLGLTIANELVQLHHSTIEVESQVGKGTTFAFNLALPHANTGHLVNTHSETDNLFFTQPLKILLADDNAFNREIAAEALLRHFEHVEIVEADNGKEVIRLFENQAFDLILMDMQMPEMNGIEATKSIRVQMPDNKRNVPIIALTASATPEEIDKALASGMNRHLGKPFKPRELAKIIAETLSLAYSKNKIGHQTSAESINVSNSAFDLTFLRDFCDGDEVQVQHFIEKFHLQYPLEIEKLATAFSNKDFRAVYQTAHSFKPQLEFVGLKEAAGLTEDIETCALHEGDWAQMEHWFTQLKTCLSSLSTVSL